MSEWLVDTLLVTGVISLALLAITVRQVLASIVLFVSLGLLLTLVWVRLEAIDVAIAEAAIGAGLTGALLLAAWRQLRHPTEEEESHERVQ